MNIVQKAEAFVFGLLKDKLSSDYLYHNFNHTMRVVKAAETIAAAEGLEGEEKEAVMLAAWFHDTGYTVGARNHEESSAGIARDFLTANGYPAAGIEEITKLIMATKLGEEPRGAAEEIIKDADCSHFADKNYCAVAEMLREEWKLTQGNEFTDLDWAVANRLMLMHKHRYYTSYAKEHFQPQKEANLAQLQENINALQKGSKKNKEKLDKKKLEKLERPDRGIDTVFRVTLNNHTRLSEIADSKANILLSVNTIIISIALTTLIPKLDSPANAHLVLPTMILMFSSVVCVIFAIISTRPKITGGTFTREDIEQQKVNLLFFGNFYKMPLDEYEWAMNEMMKDRQYLYDSMIKDLYYLGLVLNRKYKLLRTTYLLFMIGIIASVASFVYAFMAL